MKGIRSGVMVGGNMPPTTASPARSSGSNAGRSGCFWTTLTALLSSGPAPPRAHRGPTPPGRAASGLGLAAPAWVLHAPGGQIPLSVVADQVFVLGVARTVVAKVPPNFDLAAFAAELSAGRVAALEPVHKRAAYFGPDPPVAYHLLIVESGGRGQG